MKLRNQPRNSTKKSTKKNHAVKKSIKYVAAFNYIDKILIVLGATSGEVLIFSSVSVAAAPFGITAAILL